MDLNKLNVILAKCLAWLIVIIILSVVDKRVLQLFFHIILNKNLILVGIILILYNASIYTIVIGLIQDKYKKWKGIDEHKDNMKINNKKCTTSICCKVHSIPYQSRTFSYESWTGVLGMKIWESGNVEEDIYAKRLLCYISNHIGIIEICKEKGYKIDLIEEMKPRNTLAGCSGFNAGKGRSIGVMLRSVVNPHSSFFLQSRRRDGSARGRNNRYKFLTLTEIFSIVIHELCHMKYSKHNDKFKKYEQELRDMFFMVSMWHGVLPNATFQTWQKSYGASYNPYVREYVNVRGKPNTISPITNCYELIKYNVVNSIIPNRRLFICK